MQLPKLTKALYWLTRRKFKTLPNRIITLNGEIYMKRWYLIPHNRFFQIYLHEILKSDADRELHDHPWWSVSFILEGAYMEVWSRLDENQEIEHHNLRIPGYVGGRKATTAHRLELPPGIKRVRTIFITGRDKQEWGFWTKEGWVQSDEFIRQREGR